MKWLISIVTTKRRTSFRENVKAKPELNTLGACHRPASIEGQKENKGEGKN